MHIVNSKATTNFNLGSIIYVVRKDKIIKSQLYKKKAKK